MKQLILNPIVFMFILFSLSGSFYAQEKSSTAEFKVYGNCGMCKTRIEKAAKVEGVVSAQWDIKSKMIKVEYFPSKIALETIHKNIAKVGHDTDKVKADDAVYNKLPECCRYERK